MLYLYIFQERLLECPTSNAFCVTNFTSIGINRNLGSEMEVDPACIRKVVEESLVYVAASIGILEKHIEILKKSSGKLSAVFSSDLTNNLKFHLHFYNCLKY